MAVLLIVIGLAVALAAVAFVVNGRRQTASVAARAFDVGEGLISEPLPTSAMDPERIADKVNILWAKQFEPRSGELSDDVRLRLINDLGLLRAPWCVPLLTQAYAEERDPVLRAAAQIALTRCGEDTAVS